MLQGRRREKRTQWRFNSYWRQLACVLLIPVDISPLLGHSRKNVENQQLHLLSSTRIQNITAVIVYTQTSSGQVVSPFRVTVILPTFVCKQTKQIAFVLIHLSPLNLPLLHHMNQTKQTKHMLDRQKMNHFVFSSLTTTDKQTKQTTNRYIPHCHHSSFLPPFPLMNGPSSFVLLW